MKKVINNQAFFKTIIDSLNEHQHVSFMIKGNSMLPFFKDGKTEVFLKTKEQYKKMDICLFKLNGQYLLHRYMKRKKDKIYFQGDHLCQKEMVDKNAIIAYVYQFRLNNQLIQTDDIIYRIKRWFYLVFKKIKCFLKFMFL